VKSKKEGCVGAEIDCVTLFGSITDTASGKLYRIAPNADGENEVVAVDETELEDEDKASEPVALPQGEVADTPSADDLSLLSQSGDTIIDMLVVWTEQAECANSRKTKGCTLTDATKKNMEGLLKLAIEESNAAFELSGVKAELRLVHAYRDGTGYDESAGFSDALNKVTGKNDGVMDDVHTKREQYGADAVALIIDNAQYCGLGWLGPNSGRMFSVTKWSCATGYYSFVHELGHNMGLHHDRGTKRSCSDNQNYYYGYRNPDGQFRSIMAYGCKTGQCDNNKKNGCTRVQRFSNPNFKYQGKAIGDAGNDCARKLNEVRGIVAGYFPTGGTGGGGGSTTAPSPTPARPSPTPAPAPVRRRRERRRATPKPTPSTSTGCKDGAMRRRMKCSSLGRWCDYIPNARRRTWGGEVEKYCQAKCNLCSTPKPTPSTSTDCKDNGMRRRMRCSLLGRWCDYIPNARRRAWGGQVEKYCQKKCNLC